MFRLKHKSDGVLECCSDHIHFSGMTPSGGLACAWLHITNDKAVWRKSNIEVSGVDSEECLEVNVIVGVRNMLLVSTIVLRGFIDFGLKLPTSILTLGGNNDGDMLPHVLVDFGSLLGTSLMVQVVPIIGPSIQVEFLRPTFLLSLYDLMEIQSQGS